MMMRICCFGDSNTYGYDPRGYFGGRYDAADRWTDLLAEHTVINAGQNGREIPAAAFSPPEHDLFLVMLGTNDLLQGASAGETATRMERFLARMKPLCRQILLLAPPPLKRGAWVPTDALVTESLELARHYRRIAAELDILFLDTREWNIELTFDGVHFSEKGHHICAEKLQKHLDSPPA